MGLTGIGYLLRPIKWINLYRVLPLNPLKGDLDPVKKSKVERRLYLRSRM